MIRYLLVGLVTFWIGVATCAGEGSRISDDIMKVATIITALTLVGIAVLGVQHAW